jgi:hypothetical protein
MPPDRQEQCSTSATTARVLVGPTFVAAMKSTGRPTEIIACVLLDKVELSKR